MRISDGRRATINIRPVDAIGRPYFAPILREQPDVAFQVLNIGETHCPEEALGLRLGQFHGSLHPVSEGNHATWSNQSCRLADEPRFVRDIAPRVLAPDEINTARR
jgi:hypothetical protein